MWMRLRYINVCGWTDVCSAEMLEVFFNKRERMKDVSITRRRTEFPSVTQWIIKHFLLGCNQFHTVSEWVTCSGLLFASWNRSCFRPLQVCFLIWPRKLESAPPPCCPLRSAVAGKSSAFHTCTHLNNSNMSVMSGLPERFWTIWKRVVITETALTGSLNATFGFFMEGIFFLSTPSGRKSIKSRFWEGNGGLESHLR